MQGLPRGALQRGQLISEDFISRLAYRSNNEIQVPISWVRLLDPCALARLGQLSGFESRLIDDHHKTSYKADCREAEPMYEARFQFEPSEVKSLQTKYCKGD